MGREILHINTDDFYASALRLRDPGLRGRPVIVAGPPPRGMVISASYEARGDGVKRGMTVSIASRLCSRAAIFPPDWDFFRKVSRGIFSVLGRYSPAVEAVSLDEGYVDYTGCGRVFGHVLDAGSRMKREIREETGLDVSLGVASSKLVSHVASRSAKRAHMVDVYPGCEQPFLAPVDIGRFPIVGEKYSPILMDLGVFLVGDVLRFEEEIFSFCFGPWGRRLYRGARGEDDALVRPGKPADTRFHVEELLESDTDDRALLESFLYRLCESEAARLREHRCVAGSFELSIKHADGVVVRGTGRLSGGTSEGFAIFEAASEILGRVFTRRVRVRKLTLGAGRIEPRPVQVDLFATARSDPHERSRRISGAMDSLRGRFPEGIAPVFGRSMAAVGSRLS